MQHGITKKKFDGGVVDDLDVMEIRYNSTAPGSSDQRWRKQKGTVLNRNCFLSEYNIVDKSYVEFFI